MKKLIFILVAVQISTFSFAQKSQVVSAWNYLNNGELDKARTAINSAINDETTKSMAKTWFYRGNIYKAIYSDTTRKKDVNDLTEAFNSYKKVMEYDAKGEFTIDMMNPWLEVAYYTFNEAVIPYNVKDYQLAYDNFNKVSEIYGIVNSKYKQNIIDTSASFYAANAAVKLGKFDEATKIYNDLINVKHFEDPEIYSNLADIALAGHDTSGAINQLDKGIAIYPKEQNLRIKQLNLYLFSHRFNEVIDKLNAAIEKEPNRGDLYQALGSAHENSFSPIITLKKGKIGMSKSDLIKFIGKPNTSNETKSENGISEDLFYSYDFIFHLENGIVKFINAPNHDEKIKRDSSSARKAYEKALALNSEDFVSNYSLGALYYNRAVEKLFEMNYVPASDQKTYDLLKIEADLLLGKSLPFLEKARLLNPKDLETLIALRELYAQLDMVEKNEEVKKAISALVQ